MEGAKAVKSGQYFERLTDLSKVSNTFCKVLHQNEFYKYFDIDWKVFLSKKIVPDEVVINHQNETIYIIEKKNQTTCGSNDEKLYACEAKKLKYSEMLRNTGYKVEMIYLCNDWFKKPCYKDTFDFMDMKGIKHFFNEIPLDVLGICA